MRFLDRLWAEWSPGYDADADMSHVRDSLGRAENLAAALGYYREAFGASAASVSRNGRHERALTEVAPQPTLYLHRELDGCISNEFVEVAGEHLSEGSLASVVDGVGHFLHLERPDRVNKAILEWLHA